MPGSRAVFRSIVLGSVLLSTACAIWFVPESRSRGHIFDESSRGHVQFGHGDGVRRLSILINRQFPPGTLLSDLLRHIEDAGGSCSEKASSMADTAPRLTICTYENTNYFAFAYMGMGEPTLKLSRNNWTVFISHTDGVIDGHRLDGLTTTGNISREDYMEGLDRQRAEEEEMQRSNTES